MLRRILVPLDGSSFAEAAFPTAVEIARRSGGEVRLLMVSETDGRWTDQAAAVAWSEEYLARLARGRGLFHHQMTTAVRCGDPGDEILAEARESAADLIVMATHGRGAVSSFWLGSVADHCLRHAPIPLLLLRPRPAGIGSAGDRLALRRVVVPFDGSDASIDGLMAGAELARLFRIPVALVRAVQPGAAAEIARTRLERTAAPLRCDGLEVSTRVVVGQAPAPAILREVNGDVVAMATHARASVAGALLGRIADKVVRGARGPVLVVPPAFGRNRALGDAATCALHPNGVGA